MAAGDDFRDKLTEKIIEQLEAGTAPWVKPWDARQSSFNLPYNPTTQKSYRGANSLYLTVMGYDDPRWCTYKQAQEQGWQVRRGEKGSLIEYWQFRETKKQVDAGGRPIIGTDGKQKTVEVQLEKPRAFRAVVFNLSQMDNVPQLAQEPKKYDWNPIERAESILASSGARIFHDQDDRAFYRMALDTIHMPSKGQFPNEAKYYGTALHELGHWTGHESRLGRKLGNEFGSVDYAKEELRAELASYFLADKLGIPHDPSHHASYIGSWVKVLKDDKNEIFRAARDAETITDYVLALDRTKEIQEEDESLAAKLGKADESDKRVPPMAAAFDKLAPTEALKHFPELEGAYEVLAQARQLASGMLNESDAKRFLEGSRKRISEELHEGKVVGVASQEAALSR